MNYNIPLDFVHKCIVCDKRMSDVQTGTDNPKDFEVPLTPEWYNKYVFEQALCDGFTVKTSGGYGSRILDCDGSISFAVCDDCIIKKSKNILFLSHKSEYLIFEKNLIKYRNYCYDENILDIAERLTKYLGLEYPRPRFFVKISDYILNDEISDLERFYNITLCPLLNIVKNSNSIIHFTIDRNLEPVHSANMFRKMMKFFGDYKELSKFLILTLDKNINQEQVYAAYHKELCQSVNPNRVFYLDENIWKEKTK